ncbi:MAG TPA: WhiB family transcriptional regulator [Streptosporangiaceae bacterium]|jgi:WhiB family redox-sensing transcriptional regulator|nr:WhiB family transcriptional regulator [Streptosporangiaceae bacterium]
MATVRCHEAKRPANASQGGPLTGSINMGLNSRRNTYFSVFTGVRLPCPISKGAFLMPDDTAIPNAADVLSPQLLELAATDTRRRWSVHALCATTDPEIFFPSTGSLATEARAICAQCPVCRNCLAHAIAAGEPFGIWGGLDPQERRAVRRQLQRRKTSTATATGITA